MSLLIILLSLLLLINKIESLSSPVEYLIRNVNSVELYTSSLSSSLEEEDENKVEDIPIITTPYIIRYNNDKNDNNNNINSNNDNNNNNDVNDIILAGKPTVQPTFGPASTSIAESIFGGVLAGILILTLLYFTYGQYSYDIDAKAQQIEAELKKLNSSNSNDDGNDKKIGVDDSSENNNEDNENSNNDIEKGHDPDIEVDLGDIYGTNDISKEVPYLHETTPLLNKNNNNNNRNSDEDNTSSEDTVSQRPYLTNNKNVKNPLKTAR